MYWNPSSFPSTPYVCIQLVVFYPKTEKYVGIFAAQQGQGEEDAKTKQRCDSCVVSVFCGWVGGGEWGLWMEMGWLVDHATHGLGWMGGLD